MYLCLSLVRCSQNMIFVDPILVTPAPAALKQGNANHSPSFLHREKLVC